MARGSQAGEVRHLATGHEAHTALARQVEQVQQPSRRDFLQRCRKRRDHVDARVLVPGGHQPVRRQRHRQRAPDDEAEVARRRTRGSAAFCLCSEQVEDCEGVLAVRRSWCVERGDHLLTAGLGADEALGQVAQKGAGVRMGAGKDRVEVVERRWVGDHEVFGRGLHGRVPECR